MANVHRKRDRKQLSKDRFEFSKDTQVVYANSNPKYSLINGEKGYLHDVRLEKYQQCQP